MVVDLIHPALLIFFRVQAFLLCCLPRAATPYSLIYRGHSSCYGNDELPPVGYCKGTFSDIYMSNNSNIILIIIPEGVCGAGASVLPGPCQPRLIIKHFDPQTYMGKSMASILYGRRPLSKPNLIGFTVSCGGNDCL